MNIIICSDGTDNKFGRQNTNVVKLFQVLDCSSKSQKGFYDPGVGTYSPGNKIYLFGFSRGAFTVRCLAGMLHKCGLLEKGSSNLIAYASQIYNTKNNNTVAAGFKKTYCRECIPYFIGVWDTVASLGYFFGKRFFDDNLHGKITFGYQAAAMDEKRKKFPVSLWNEKNRIREQTIEQVWFPGVHCDVGGYYKERGLSDGALKWMIQKAESAGVKFKENWQENIAPDPTAKNALHESRQTFWKFWKPVQRHISENSLIHQSVIDRIKAGIGYNPPNLPDNYRVVA